MRKLRVILASSFIHSFIHSTALYLQHTWDRIGSKANKVPTPIESQMGGRTEVKQTGI